MASVKTSPVTYIALGDDGRHVSLSRGGVPNSEDFRQIGEGLKQQGKGGWLVRLEGDYWSTRGRPVPHLVATLGATTSVPFNEAVVRFEARRHEALGLPPARRANA